MKHLRSSILPLLFGISLILCAGCSSDTDSGQQEKRPEQTVPPTAVEKQALNFNGGPTGGTFNYFANKMSSLITEANPWLKLTPMGSSGSGMNVCALARGTTGMAITYAGDVFLNRSGELACKGGKSDRLRAMASLYGAPAQLVVRADSNIHTVFDLKGHSIAIGNPGSGAALAAKRFFEHLGIWDAIVPRHLGYSRATAEFRKGNIDAFWVLVGYPNASVIEAASHALIRIIDLHAEAAKSGFYDHFPFYLRAEVPAGTYDGQNVPVSTFQDAALWCVASGVPDDVVYQSLATVFSETGLESMRKAHKAARSMALDNGLTNLPIPLHPGAARFWKEQGANIPSSLLPQPPGLR